MGRGQQKQKYGKFLESVCSLGKKSKGVAGVAGV